MPTMTPFESYDILSPVTELLRQLSRSRAEGLGTVRAGVKALFRGFTRVVDGFLDVLGVVASSDHRKTVGNWAMVRPNW